MNPVHPEAMRLQAKQERPFQFDIRLQTEEPP